MVEVTQNLGEELTSRGNIKCKGSEVRTSVLQSQTEGKGKQWLSVAQEGAIWTQNNLGVLCQRAPAGLQADVINNLGGKN